MTKDFDVIVVGAGVVGSAIAYALANQNRSVLLVERDLSEPDRIVGELLQPGGVEALQKLGLKSCIEGIDAIPVKGYEVIYHGSPVNIPYPIVDSGRKPTGASFHYGRFVTNLRKIAKNHKNITLVEATAKDLISNPISGRVIGVKCCKHSKDSDPSNIESSTVSSEIGTHFFAPLTIVADGCFSRFRKYASNGTPKVKSNFVGTILEDVTLPAPYHGHVLLGDHSPILLYQIGKNETRILIDIPGKVPSIANGDLNLFLSQKVLPVLPESLRNAFKRAISSKRLRSMPNSFLSASSITAEGLILIGDSLNMRHPLTGGGMTVGLNDAVLLSQLLSSVPDFSDCNLVTSSLDELYWRRKNLSSVINILSMALYSLFAADDDQLKVLQLGCFKYFELGGACIDGPVSLLSGLLRSPLMLFVHFFAVAFYSIYILLRSMPFYMLPIGIIKSIFVFLKACEVILPFIWSELF